MKKRDISLLALAKELDTETGQIVQMCKLHDLKRPDWIEVGTPGRTEWRGRVSLGLAETIRQWGRDRAFGPRRNASRRDNDLAWAAAEAARETQTYCFGDELHAILGKLQRNGIDISSSRGRKLAWKSWSMFVSMGVYYQSSVECARCRAEFAPEIDRRFVDTYIDQDLRPPSRWRKAERQLCFCPSCRKT